MNSAVALIFLCICALTTGQDPFTATCLNGDVEKISYSDPTLNIRLVKGAPCSTTKQSGSQQNTITLTTDCTTDHNLFVILQDSDDTNVRGGMGTKYYTISCNLDSKGDAAQVHLPKIQPTASIKTPTTIASVDKIQDSQLEMLLVENHATGLNKAPMPIEIGKKLDLVIKMKQVPERSFILIPEKCTATGGTPQTELMIWKTKDPKKDHMDKLIGAFFTKQVDDTLHVDYAYAEFYPFEFVSDAGGQITLDCDLLICPFTTNWFNNPDSGTEADTCKTSYQDFVALGGKPTNADSPANTNTRRRRSVSSSDNKFHQTTVRTTFRAFHSVQTDTRNSGARTIPGVVMTVAIILFRIL